MYYYSGSRIYRINYDNADSTDYILLSRFGHHAWDYRCEFWNPCDKISNTNLKTGFNAHYYTCCVFMYGSSEVSSLALCSSLDECVSAWRYRFRLIERYKRNKWVRCWWLYPTTDGRRRAGKLSTGSNVKVIYNAERYCTYKPITMYKCDREIAFVTRLFWEFIYCSYLYIIYNRPNPCFRNV